MFRAVFVLLTCAAVLWHALVGCCAHHEHRAPAATACVSPCCGCGHSTGSFDGDSIESLDSPQSGVMSHCSIVRESSDSKENCDGGRCAFVAPGSGGDAPLKAVDVEWRDLYAAFSPSCDATSNRWIALSHDTEPPLLRGDLRRHLALGVLRI